MVLTIHVTDIDNYGVYPFEFVYEFCVEQEPFLFDR